MTDQGKTLLEKIQALAPQIAACSAEIAAARNIPADIVADLRGTGLFRMFAPRHYGGLELDYPEALDIFRTLAGGSAVYLDSPLQRRLRDIMVLGQHAVLQHRQFAGIGAFLLSEGESGVAEIRTGPQESPHPKVARLRA